MELFAFIISFLVVGVILYMSIYDEFHLLSFIRYLLFWPGMIIYDYRREHPGIIKKISRFKKFMKYHFTEKEWGKWMD